MNRKTLLTTIIFLMTACGHVEADTPPPSPKAAALPTVLLEDATAVSTTVSPSFYEKTVKSALYEPLEGCYLGAYILSDKPSSFEIEKFEELTGQHAIYSYNTKVTSPFPTDWVLSCIANLKTPSIFLYPENPENPFDLLAVEAASKKYGEFYVPMFIHFYPLDDNINYSAAEYTDFYKKARELFRKNASNAAFVWTVSESNLPIMSAYYPGDNYVDWVGVSIARSADHDTVFPQISASLNYISNTFQENKPIMLSRLAISHFSGENHMYYSKEAGEQLVSLYDDIIKNYPRIKAVNYMSYNGLDPVNQDSSPDNFSVTDNNNMREYYKTAIANLSFLTNIDFSSGQEEFNQKLRFYGP